MRWRSGLLTASSALLLAGCGGEHAAPPPKPPRIPASVAQQLAAEADHVATLTPGTCEARDAAARFRSHVIASIGLIPSRYQEPLMSAANSLVDRLAACVEPKVEPEHGKGHGKKHGRKKHGADNQGDGDGEG